MKNRQTKDMHTQIVTFAVSLLMIFAIMIMSIRIPRAAPTKTTCFWVGLCSADWNFRPKLIRPPIAKLKTVIHPIFVIAKAP